MTTVGWHDKQLSIFRKQESQLRNKCYGSVESSLSSSIEVVDEQSKLDPLLPQIKRRVGDNGLVTIQEVYAL